MRSVSGLVVTWKAAFDFLAAFRTADVLRQAIQEARNASAEMTQTIGLPKGALHLVVN